MSEPRRGTPAFVRFGCEPYARGRDLQPERVEHAQLGISWQVTGILDCWQHPGRAEQRLGQDALTKWWLLKVSGPLPDCPHESGEFVMQVSGFGDCRLWWIMAEALAG